VGSYAAGLSLRSRQDRRVILHTVKIRGPWGEKVRICAVPGAMRATAGKPAEHGYDAKLPAGTTFGPGRAAP